MQEPDRAVVALREQAAQAVREAGGARPQEAGRAREELLWQLNDVLLSKSMLAHATLDAYISALDRI